MTSRVMGFYSDMPGTIIRRNQAQWGNDVKYVIELDCGKRICLASSKIKRIKEEQTQQILNS